MVVERLTVRTWLTEVLPFVVRRRLRRAGMARRCYTIEASPPAARVARACRALTGLTVEPLRFRLIEIRDERGLSIRLRTAFEDLTELQGLVLADPMFRAAVAEEPPGGRLRPYLAKAVSLISKSDRRTLWRALLVIQVCVWTARLEGGEGAPPTIWLERRPWWSALERYASRFGVVLVGVWAPPSLRAALLGVLSPRLIQRLRRVRAMGARTRWRGRRVGRRSIRAARAGGASAAPRPPSSRGPRLAVEYYGHLNLDHPERFSDLFFWQRSSIPGRDVLVTFNIPRDPLDGPKWAQLQAHGIDAVALRPDAATLRGAPQFCPTPACQTPAATSSALNGWPRRQEKDWFLAQVHSYRVTRAYWRELFASQGVKLFVSWYKYDATHCAIADALADVGGLGVIYQRASDFRPSVETAIATDIVFGYSALFGELERQSGSTIGAFVITGYLGDHRFALLREGAARLRARLQGHGARHILAFMDENSGDDPRWHTGHAFMRENYAFLLEKLLAEPWLGLVIKPKVPATLRRRLGPVAALLAQAEATGRCFVYEGGTLHGSHPPAAAALAADVAIHGHLCAATAGVEAALAGVPTLLMDREGWAVSPLYRLGVGRVVFTDWPSLWKACLEHWRQPSGVPGFGDWSPILDELDPFRDGRAAQRMGTYLQWLLEGFQGGLKRETVMADAAERYAKRWGHDRVLSIGGQGVLARAAISGANAGLCHEAARSSAAGVE